MEALVATVPVAAKEVEEVFFNRPVCIYVTWMAEEPLLVFINESLGRT